MLNATARAFAALIVGAAMFGMFFFITFFVQGVREYSALKTGFAFLPLALVIGITSQVVARLLPRFGPKPLVVTGTAVLAVAMLWLSTVKADSSYAGTVLPGLLLMGLALGLLFVPLTATAVSNIVDTDAGLASALLNVGQQVGHVIEELRGRAPGRTGSGGARAAGPASAARRREAARGRQQRPAARRDPVVCQRTAGR